MKYKNQWFSMLEKEEGKVEIETRSRKFVSVSWKLYFSTRQKYRFPYECYDRETVTISRGQPVRVHVRWPRSLALHFCHAPRSVCLARRIAKVKCNKRVTPRENQPISASWSVLSFFSLLHATEFAAKLILQPTKSKSFTDLLFFTY